MNRKAEPELLSVQDLERLTGRRAATWRKDILLRRIPTVRIGRLVRVPREALDALIRKGWRSAVEAEGSIHER